MARPRKRVKRKSSVIRIQCSPPVGNSRKRPSRIRRSEAETYVQRKRRRTTRYNLRRSNSVILVGETPCCQSPEQQEKYSKLGLNSALFLKGSQRPKRKQSHISVITISSDDEETSEERTTEWVNSLAPNYQLSVESEHFIDDPLEREPTFQPLCSSTPNTSKSTVHHQPDECNKPEETDTCKQISSEASSGYRRDKLSEHQECNLGSTPGSHASLRNDQVEQDQTFQLVISVPDTLTLSQSVMQLQSGESNNIKESGSLTSESSSGDRVERFHEADGTAYKSFCQGSRPDFNFASGFGISSSCLNSKTPISGSGNTGNVKTIDGVPAKKARFYFGSSTDSRNVASASVSPLETYFNNRMDISTSGGFKFGSAISNAGQGETNQFDTNNVKHTNNQTESNSINSDDPDGLLERNSQN